MSAASSLAWYCCLTLACASDGKAPLLSFEYTSAKAIANQSRIPKSKDAKSHNQLHSMAKALEMSLQA